MICHKCGVWLEASRKFAEAVILSSILVCLGKLETFGIVRKQPDPGTEATSEQHVYNFKSPKFPRRTIILSSYSDAMALRGSG